MSTTLITGALAAPTAAEPGVDEETQVSTAESRAAAKARKKKSAIVLKTPNAPYGSTIPVSLVNLKTGETTDVALRGKGESTRKRVPVKPGRYRIVGAPAVHEGTTYVIDTFRGNRDVKRVKGPYKPDHKRVKHVSFALGAQAPATALTTESTGVDRVELAWTGPEDVARYTLRRTVGTKAAGSPDAGVAVPLASATSTSVLDDSVAPATTYTYTLFAERSSGASVAPASVLAVTASADGSSASYSLAPNTVLATDFASLEPRRLSDSTVQVTLGSQSSQRVSSSRIALPRGAAAPAAGCVVGAPFVVTTEVAGEDAFYGVIERCDEPTRTGPRGTAQVKAAVNTDVPLNAAFANLEVDAPIEGACTGMQPVGAEEGLGREPQEQVEDPCAEPTEEPADPGTPGDEPTDPGTPGDEPTDPGTPGDEPTDPGTPGDEPTDPGYPGDEPTDPGYPGDEPTDPDYSGEEPGMPRDFSARTPMGRGKLSCEGQAGNELRLNPYLQPGGNARLHVNSDGVSWDINAEMTIGINPTATFSGTYECQVEFRGASFQLTYAPVPINLNLKPLLRGTAEAKMELSGPRLAATVGFHTDGHVRPQVRYERSCSWWRPCFNIPVGIHVDRRAHSYPIGRVSPPSNPSLYMEGSLTFDMGLAATIAVGYENSFVGAKAGFTLNLIPISASLQAKYDNRWCATMALNGKVELGLVAEAWVMFKSWGLKYEGDLGEWEIDYGISRNIPAGCG